MCEMIGLAQVGSMPMATRDMSIFWPHNVVYINSSQWRARIFMQGEQPMVDK